MVFTQFFFDQGSFLYIEISLKYVFESDIGTDGKLIVIFVNDVVMLRQAVGGDVLTEIVRSGSDENIIGN